MATVTSGINEAGNQVVVTEAGLGEGPIDASLSPAIGVAVNPGQESVAASVAVEGRLGMPVWGMQYVEQATPSINDLLGGRLQGGSQSMSVDMVTAGLGVRGEGELTLETRRANIYVGPYVRWRHQDLASNGHTFVTRNWDLSAAAGAAVRNVSTTEDDQGPHTGGYLTLGAATCVGQNCPVTAGGNLTAVLAGQGEGFTIIPAVSITWK